MTSIEQLLIETVALADAIHLPLRDPFAPSWASGWQLRWSVSSTGLPYRSGGGSKEAERALTEAVAADWLLRRFARRRTVGVAITRAGLEHARGLLGLPADVDCTLAAAVDARAPRPGNYVSEEALFDDLNADEIEIMLLPALTAGLVVSMADTTGLVFYARSKRPLPRATEYSLVRTSSEFRRQFSFGLGCADHSCCVPVANKPS